MAVRYLTQEWIDALSERAGAAEDLKGALKGVDLMVQQVVNDAPEGDGQYYMGIRDGKVLLGLGRADSPDVTIRQTYETAVAMDKGELDAQQAFMSGRLEITGNMAKIMQYQPQLGRLGAISEGLEIEY